APSSSCPTLRRPRPTLCPYPTLFRSDAGALSPLEVAVVGRGGALAGRVLVLVQSHAQRAPRVPQTHAGGLEHTVQALLDRLSAEDRKSTRLNSSHVSISYAVFCVNKK